MQIQITLDGSEKAEAVAKLATALEGMYGISRPMSTLEVKVNGKEIREEFAKLQAELDSKDLLAKLEAENPQFGQQPVPDVPLAATAAPFGADAEASASAPEAPTGSAPMPPVEAPDAPNPPAAGVTPGPAEPVDAAGLPWDERIHAGSRAKIADGTWRKKRGVPEEKVAAVEAELRAEFPAAPPAPPAVAEAPNPPAAGSGLQFKQITSRVTVALSGGTLTPQVLIAKLKELGVENLAALDKRPDLWQAALDTLGV